MSNLRNFLLLAIMISALGLSLSSPITEIESTTLPSIINTNSHDGDNEEKTFISTITINLKLKLNSSKDIDLEQFFSAEDCSCENRSKNNSSGIKVNISINNKVIDTDQIINVSLSRDSLKEDSIKSTTEQVLTSLNIDSESKSQVILNTTNNINNQTSETSNNRDELDLDSLIIETVELADGNYTGPKSLPSHCYPHFTCRKKISITKNEKICITYLMLYLDCGGEPIQVLSREWSRTLDIDKITIEENNVNPTKNEEKFKQAPVHMVDFPCQPNYLPDRRGICREVW